MSPDDALRDRRLVERRIRLASAWSNPAGWPAPIVERGRAQEARARSGGGLDHHPRFAPCPDARGRRRVHRRRLRPSASASVAPTGGGGTAAYEQFKPDAALLAAAKAEGTLTTIALPHDWCNYGR